MLSFNSVHKRFKFNGKHYNFEDLNTLALHLIEEKEAFKNDIGSFLQQWQNESKTILLKTSGSTGTPKTVKINKQAMVNSAIATGTYFKLQPGNQSLLCLPAHYIAGKMMLVRALVLGLELDSIEPKSNLEIDINKHYHFTAMVPLQLEKNNKKLKNINTVIVGGAKVSSALNNKLQGLHTTFFETYGMTETVSHIAVKQLNNLKLASNYFNVLPNIVLSQDERDCLIINAPGLSSEIIVTNDVVKLHSKNTFEWLGRADSVINSGGVKIFPEQIENILSSKISSRFFIASEEDKMLGSKIILIIEGVKKELESDVFSSLDRFSKPKKVYFLAKFEETTSGKIQRKKTLQLIEQ